MGNSKRVFKGSVDKSKNDRTHKKPPHIGVFPKSISMNYVIMPGLKNKTELPVSLKNSDQTIVLGVCEDYFGYTHPELDVRKRTRALTYARQVAMYLLREHTHLTLLQIGDLFHRDHTSVMHAIQKIKDLIFSDPKVKSDITDLQSYF